MSDSERRSWEDIVDRLQRAATELRSAAGRPHERSAEEEAAAARLKADVSRLEQSAADLKEKLTSGFDRQRSEVDRERVEQSTGQIKVALDELIDLARSVTTDLGTAAESSYRNARPEVRTAIRTLEDVASSAGAWIKSAIDPSRERHHGQRDAGPRAPLDEL
jgi:chromosome segregation ATPase